MDVVASLQTLLHRSIDYAGLFPPAKLALNSALANQADYIRLPESWMLNAFVLPADQFDAAKEFQSGFDSKHPLCFSALGPKTMDAVAFRRTIGEVTSAIRALLGSTAGLVSISQLEMCLPNDVDLSLLEEAHTVLGSLSAFWETSVNEADRTVALLAEHNASARQQTFGYKLRTGGVTADAFPSSEQIARALVTAAKHQVPIKFTAGLHHPVRQYRDEVHTKMHGFLNVMGAGVLTAEHGWDVTQATAMLDDEETGSFIFTDDFLSWRDWKISIERLKERRKLVTTFGSCSFDEPREDLRLLRLL